MKSYVAIVTAISFLVQSSYIATADDIEQAMTRQSATKKLLNIQFPELWPNYENNNEDLILLGQVLEEIEGGRGKSHKYKKLRKTLYPLFMGVLIAKVVLIPLILKMLTAISTAALVMSKIALITTGILALKWIFSSSSADKDYTHFELVYVPTKQDYSKPYRGLKASTDQFWSNSVLVSDRTANNKQQQQQTYIPLKTLRQNNETPYRYSDSGVSSISAVSKISPNDAAASDFYRYNQHHNNYYSNGGNMFNDGKPFL